MTYGPGSTRDGCRAPSGKRVAKALAEVDRLELEIEKIVAGGDGLGRADGIPVFVPLAAPGDRLLVEVVDRRPRYARGRILEILRPGPGRRKPPCEHFGSCGGCDLQHLEDTLQTEWRVRAAHEALVRLGRIDADVPVRVVRGKPQGYRLRAQLHLEPSPEAPRVGYFARGSNQLVPVSACPVLEPRLERFALGLARQEMERVPNRLDVAIGSQRVTTAPALDGLPTGAVRRRIGDFEYRYDARCFFQAHDTLTERLVEAAVGTWSGKSAVDLYAGVGLFSLPLAVRYERVTAVESDKIAVRYARGNARRGKLPVDVVGSAVDSWVGDLKPCDRVLVDPPRTGLSIRVVSRLGLVQPARLTYVSCHAATLARDLRRLSPSFELEELVFIDMFPQTGHIEVVAQMRAREPRG